MMSMAPPGQWLTIKYAQGLVPRTGDLIIWSSYPAEDIGWAGHVALCISANQNSMKTFDQDWPWGAPCQIVTNHDYAAVLGWIRFKG
jgi:hypothetical protein